MTKYKTIGVVVALSAGLAQPSSAVVRPKGAEGPVVAAGLAPRAHRTIAWSRPAQLTAVGLPGWSAMWDRDTDVPVRLWGPGAVAAGAMAKPGIAEAAARQFLAAHLALLAPGASIHDFVVVANQLGGAGDVRSVGFAQHAGGVRVLGGAVGFSFKRDRLVMVSSTALPNVTVVPAPNRLDANRIVASAIGWLAQDGHTVAVRGTQLDRVIVPLVRPRGATGPVIGYRLADQLSVESRGEPGRWDVWVDATDASPIARRSTIFFGSGTVMFDVPDRAPTLVRTAKPAPFVVHKLNGVATTSAADGSVTWEAEGNATVAPGLSGRLIKVINKAGNLVTDTLDLAPGGSVTWTRASDEFSDAQLSSFVHASAAKEFSRNRLHPTLPYFDEQLSVSVNESSTCNAYSTGDDIHFYRRETSLMPGGINCENTGRLADVVYHEFGHSLHHNSIIEGVGQFDGSLSEGLADTLAASITGDHGMGRGFFLTEAPLRDLDPVGLEKRWPEDATGEVHAEGEIIGGALWDLRKALIGKHGDTAGVDLTLKIFYGIMQRASDIPTSYVEALVSDDDDGDLTNGTPNQCEINLSFGPHGLADPRIALGITAPVRDDHTVSLTVKPPASTAACPGPMITRAVVDWTLRGGEGGQVDLVASDSAYTAVIPTQATGSTVQYKVNVTLSDGSALTYPENAADPMYEFYVGELTTLWCADFEAGAEDWTHGGLPSNRDEWEAGAPVGIGGDPRAAYAGTGVFGIDLSGDGMYRSRAITWAESPEIDLQGNTSVRLQYRRWLGVEDGFFDHARIAANGTTVWSNDASASEPMAAGVNHIDKEWRFHDVDLSAPAGTGTLKLRFELESDAGASFGGWTLDEVCIVAAKGSTCGNGTIETGETCDDGNTSDGDDCPATCDDAIEAGCCSVGASPGGALALSALALAIVLRRRRYS